MRFKEFAPQILSEIAMNPNSLRALASKINALAGMEFEMYVPGVMSEPDYDIESEPDYDQDERCTSIDDIVNFFSGGDGSMSRNELIRFREKLEEDYYEWRDQFFEEADDVKDSDWLDAEGYQHMSDIENNYDCSWPHWIIPEPEGGNMKEVGDDFSQSIGRKVNVSEKYHGAPRNPGEYALEPDGSLDDIQSDDDRGMEFISPPLPFVEMLSDLHKVKAWADKTGCYTNESTGLHMNVSIPGINTAEFDYVKLALLLGDTYVLDSFGRRGNFYCKSSLAELKQRTNGMNPIRVTQILDNMRKGLAQIAAQEIHNGSTGKMVSINNKGNYIEFRSPGGDWLNTNFNEIENTLLRTVVAYDAAADPAKYRQEYLKKLYKVLNITNEEDPIAYFAKYSAGQLPKVALQSFIKNLQRTRQTNRNPKEPVELKTNGETGPAWQVTPDGNNWYILHGHNPQAARAAARYMLTTEFPSSLPDDQIRVRPYV